MNEQELFSPRNTQGVQQWVYPEDPGFKKEGTSSLAASSMQERARSLRERVLSFLRNTEATADETSAQLGESVLAVRPRFSELKASGKIIETGERRRNSSGKLADVWRTI